MGTIIQKNTKINYQSALILATLILVSLLVVTGSFASFVFAIVIFLIGLTPLLSSHYDKNDKRCCLKLYYLSFSVFIVLVILQVLDTKEIFFSFSDPDNDFYMFWLESEEGAKADSWGKIFRNCIIDNIYIENGGYYFYIQTIAYIASHWFDGNHLALQYLGTAFPGVLSSIFVFSLIKRFTNHLNAYKYALYYVLLSPAVIVYMGIHRDGLIAFLYLIVIYIWLAYDFNYKNVIILAFLALVLTYLRLEHGLFAFVFILLSAYTSTSKKKYFATALVLILVVLYAPLLYELVIGVFDVTTSYYEIRGQEALEEINSGLGRYVYQFPFPIKQIAQIFLVNMQFPSWVYLSNSQTFYGIIMGVYITLINVFWFYLFLFSLYLLFKASVRKLPRKLLFSLLVFFIFILLNTSNLTLRRVVCIYPCLYIVYLYIKDSYYPRFEKTQVPTLFGVAYMCLCLVYVVLIGIYS